MAKTFDEKIRELQDSKFKFDLSFFLTKKQEYQQRINELLEAPINELDEKDAYKEARECYAKMKDVDNKIQHIPEDADEKVEDINKTISFYQREKEKVKNIPLRRETNEWIAEIFWWNIVKYAEETNNEELMKRLRTRTITLKEYMNFLEKEYSEFLDMEYNEDLKKKHDETEKMYNDLFKTHEKTSNWKSTVELPEWMSERIRQEIKDFEEFKWLSADDIENFIKKELRKNWWEIKDKHIRNKFKNLDEYKVAYKYISLVCKEYPQFKIIKDTTKNSIIGTSSKWKNDRLVEEAIQNWSLGSENHGVKNEKSIKLRKIWKIEDLEEKCKEYINLFKELWCIFCDEQNFSQELMKAITTQTHMQFDNGIQVLLLKMIQTNLKPEESKKYWYFSYKLSNWYDARRILAYPNGEIFTICPHSDYETYINNKPPLGKRKKHK